MTDETKDALSEEIDKEKIKEIEQKIKNLRKLFKNIEDTSGIKKDFKELCRGKINEIKIDDQTIITKDEYEKLNDKGIVLNNNDVLPYSFSRKSPDILFSYLSGRFSDIKDILDFSVYNLEVDSKGCSTNLDEVKKDYWNQINRLKNSNDGKIHVVLRTLKFSDDKNLSLSAGHSGFAIIINGKVYHFDTIGYGGFSGYIYSRSINSLKFNEKEVKNVYLTDNVIQGSSDRTSCITISYGTIESLLKYFSKNCNKDIEKFDDYLQQFFFFY